jgi:hypothetical protein
LPENEAGSGDCATPNGSRISPPVSISKAVEAKTSRGSRSRDERYEPVAHASAEHPTSAIPDHVAPPSGWNRSAMPAKPTTTPTIATRGGRSPPAMRRQTTISGTEAMISEATPVGTSCSATKRMAFAPGRSSPISTAEASSARVTRNASRPRLHHTTTAITPPASRKRVETAKNEGMVSPATLIPR